MQKIIQNTKNIYRFRFYSIKHATKKTVKYTNTINLPKTKFPSRLSPAKRQEVEKGLVEGSFSNAYVYQEEYNQAPTFVLHDGPPYANGDLHMGHAVNKILKDITLRQNVAKGQKVHYIPGWDCHGLPIELKAMTSSKSGDPLTIRQKCRKFALDAVSRQKEEFRSWGILTDWPNSESIYLTFNPTFISNQLRMFLNFFKSGLVYRDLKPVYWSPSSRTALAEAELEYDHNFISPSVYVRFALNNVPKLIDQHGKSIQQIYALVWTTTPWTLPSNQGICYNSNLEYSIVRLINEQTGTDKVNGHYMLATNLLEEFESLTEIKTEVVQKIKGDQLHGCTYAHPLNNKQNSMPFLPGEHVQDTKGTGLVHTAPAHGPEDFLISLERKMPVICYVNEEGRYTQEAPPFLRGKHVLDEGDNLVLDHIANDVVFSGKVSHSYPIDWRTKQPVIIRASEQWFINTEILKNTAVNEINKIEIYPKSSSETYKKTLITQVQKRPYWCISRQRVWGVPIPVFYEKRSGKVITNEKIIEHVCGLIHTEGSIDFWWTKTVEEILPSSLLSELDLTSDNLVKGGDIFDIWFDSGTSWSNTLSGDKIANLYLEGFDQFTGWFQSSLLTSIAARNYSPYKSLFVHGFTVDEKGHKMSKSLGNVISPKTVTEQYGTDVLRWWVASHGTQHASITVSNNLLQQSAENLGKIRLTIRYLNGVIGEKSEQKLNESQQTYLNRFLLSSLVSFDEEIQTSYDSYEYNRVVANVQNFVANQLSSVYVHLVKDRLYCGENDDLQNIRFTLTKCYELLCKALWPIAPFLVEESWSYYDSINPFHKEIVKTNGQWKNSHVESVLKTALDVKRLINQSTSDLNTWTLGVRILCGGDKKNLSLLQNLQPHLNKPIADSELCEILQVSKVTLTAAEEAAENVAIEVTKLDSALCPRCRRFSVANEELICNRCKNVLQSKHY